MIFNEIFDKAYCINLKSSTQRWEYAKSQFDRFGLEVDRFDAVNGKEVIPEGKNGLLAGEVGIIRSNYEIIKDAKEKGYKQIVIFEDDVEMDPDFDKKFDEYYNAVPENWAFIYMGGNHVGGYRHINDKIATIYNTYAIHAICVKDVLFDHILSLLPKERHAVDVTYAHLQKVFPSYVFRPHLCWQKDGVSDIQGGYQNYHFLKK